MKYPLILGELIKVIYINYTSQNCFHFFLKLKCTEDDHPDKKNLILASGLMTAVATYINESKRKKEIVLKYRDSGLEDKLSQRFSRLNMHSVAKKSSRIGMLLKTTLGMAPTVSFFPAQIASINFISR